jgi:hypothetical protein
MKKKPRPKPNQGIAQTVESQIWDLVVRGSNPLALTIFNGWSRL